MQVEQVFSSFFAKFLPYLMIFQIGAHETQVSGTTHYATNNCDTSWVNNQNHALISYLYIIYGWIVFFKLNLLVWMLIEYNNVILSVFTVRKWAYVYRLQNYLMNRTKSIFIKTLDIVWSCTYTYYLNLYLVLKLI